MCLSFVNVLMFIGVFVLFGGVFGCGRDRFEVMLRIVILQLVFMFVATFIFVHVEELRKPPLSFL